MSCSSRCHKTSTISTGSSFQNSQVELVLQQIETGLAVGNLGLEMLSTTVPLFASVQGSQPRAQFLRRADPAPDHRVCGIDGSLQGGQGVEWFTRQNARVRKKGGDQVLGLGACLAVYWAMDRDLLVSSVYEDLDERAASGCGVSVGALLSVGEGYSVASICWQVPSPLTWWSGRLQLLRGADSERISTR